MATRKPVKKVARKSAAKTSKKCSDCGCMCMNCNCDDKTCKKCGC